MLERWCRLRGSHYPRVHRTPSGAALVLCAFCGTRLTWLSSGVVASMLPGELEAIARDAAKEER